MIDAPVSLREELRALGRGLVLFLRASPLAAGLQVLIPLVQGASVAVVFVATGVLVDNAPGVTAQPQALQSVVIAVAVIGIVLVVNATLGATHYLLVFIASHRFSATLESRLMAAVGSLPGLAHLEDPRTADLVELARWARDAPPRLVETLSSLLMWTGTAVGTGAVVAGFRWWVPIVVIAAYLPGAVHEWRLSQARNWTMRAGAEDLRHADYHRELALDPVAGKELRIFGLGSWLLGRQEHAWQRGMRAVLEELLHRGLRRSLLWSLFTLPLLGAPFVLLLAAGAQGGIDPGPFSAVLLSLVTFIGAVGAFAPIPAYIRRDTGFLPHAFRVLDLPRTTPGVRAEGHRRPPDAATPRIRLEGVSFAYPGTDQLVLDGVDLEIPSGSSLALVGENGAGKSTLVKLLCRFYDPLAGRITLDDVDLRDLDPDELRQRIAVIFQDFLHYPFTAARNIGLGCIDRLTDTELIREAARRSGSLELIETLPQGAETVLAREFGGVDLSSGQWQRIALARALMARLGRHASLLILDEPTAALDVRAEHDLYQRFTHLTRGCTTLLVSHRLSTVRMADRIAVLEDGRITEHGTHTELMRRGGRYAELYRLQASRFTDQERANE